MEQQKQREERTVVGKIKVWKANIDQMADNFYKRSIMLDSSNILDTKWHSLTAMSMNALKVAEDAYPVGTCVEFVEFKNGNYWNYKPKSIKQIAEPDLPHPQQPTNQAQAGTVSEYADMSKAEWAEKDRKHLRNEALVRATGLLQVMKVDGMPTDDVIKLWEDIAEGAVSFIYKPVIPATTDSGQLSAQDGITQEQVIEETVKDIDELI